MSFAEAVCLAETGGGPVTGSGGYRPRDLAGSYKMGGVGPSPAYSFGADAAEVEVDLETGEVKVLRIEAAHDLGKAINPPMAEGQVQGAVVMGFGEALLERHAFLPGGQLRTPDLLEYRLPTSLDAPHVDPLLVESIEPEGPFGAKEVGEGSLHPSLPAIANALHDATGVWFHELPVDPAMVLAALRQAGRRSGHRPTAGLRDRVADDYFPTSGCCARTRCVRPWRRWPRPGRARWAGARTSWWR